MVDQLSMNFGMKNKFKQNDNVFGESASVASVITKGGTVVNPFAFKKKRENSNPNITNINFGESRGADHRSKSKNSLTPISGQITGAGQFKKVPSRTNVHFDTGDDGNDQLADLKASLQKANMNMIRVYLQTPYKVLSIDQINKKLKE